MFRVCLYLFFALLFANAALAQDERRVVSPDGRVEFRLLVAAQPDGGLPRLAYQIWYRGRILIDTSCLGLDLYEQEPLLGENIGLTAAETSTGPGFNSLIGHYMQNGSLGRLLDMEVRAWDSGAAFRYIIPRSTPVERLMIADEATEFAVPHDRGAPLALPFVCERKGVGWISIGETQHSTYPRMSLAEESEDNVLLSRLARPHRVPDVVFDGRPPLTTPWRVIAIGPDRQSVTRSGLPAELD